MFTAVTARAVTAHIGLAPLPSSAALRLLCGGGADKVTLTRRQVITYYSFAVKVEGVPWGVRSDAGVQEWINIQRLNLINFCS